MGLEIGETSRVDGRILEDASLVWSEVHTLVAPLLEEASFEELCGDIVMGSTTPSIRLIDPICNEPLDLTPISSPLPPITPSYMLAFHESLGDIRGYNPSSDPYCTYLEDFLRKIMWSTFFPHTFNFSIVFGKFKRLLTSLASSFVVFSYLHHSEMHAITYDKLLRGLTASEWSNLSLDGRSG